MARKKTAAELRAENRFLRQHNIGENVTKILLAIINKGAYVVIAFFIYKAIDTLAGKDTNANIDIKAKGEISIPGQDSAFDSLVSKISESCIYIIVLAVFLAFLGIRYGWKQAKLRKDTVERLQQRNQFLESKVDPDRTSSKLTPRGDTNPEDLS